MNVIDETHNHFERGGLSRAIGPDDTNNLLLLNMKRNLMEDLDAPIGGTNVFQIQQAHLFGAQNKLQRRVRYFGSLRVRLLRYSPHSPSRRSSRNGS